MTKDHKASRNRTLSVDELYRLSNSDPALPKALAERYVESLRSATPDVRSRYVDRIHAELGRRPGVHFATRYLLPSRYLEEIEALCRAMSTLLTSPTYERHFEDRVFPPGPRKRRDLFGSIDLHLGADGLRIIEVHCSPPGGIAICEPLTKSSAEAFPDLVQYDGNFDFVDRLVEAACEGDRRQRVAIMPGHLPNQAVYFSDYRALVRQFERRGLTTGLHSSRGVTVHQGRPCWDGVTYDQVLSLMIPLDWMREPGAFAELSAAWGAAPEHFFPHPRGFELTTKRMLPMLNDLARWVPELTADQRDVLESATLPAVPLAAFESVEALLAHLGGSPQIVVKPYEGYRAIGVLIQPDREALESVFARKAAENVVQQYYPGFRAPAMREDGDIQWIDLRLRAVFLEGELAALFAVSNPPGPRWILPVGIV